MVALAASLASGSRQAGRLRSLASGLGMDHQHKDLLPFGRVLVGTGGAGEAGANALRVGEDEGGGEVVAMPPPWRVPPGRSRHAMLKKITERSRAVDRRSLQWQPAKLRRRRWRKRARHDDGRVGEGEGALWRPGRARRPRPS